MAKPTFDVYQDKAGEYRWRFIAANGQIVATGAEGYDGEYNANRAMFRFMELVRSVSTAEMQDDPRTPEQVAEDLGQPAIGTVEVVEDDERESATGGV